MVFIAAKYLIKSMMCSVKYSTAVSITLTNMPTDVANEYEKI